MSNDNNAVREMNHLGKNETVNTSQILKSYDLSQVLKVSRGDMGFVQSVVRMFIVKTPIYVEKIIKAFEAGSYQEMGEEAHQLKQSVYAMGINSLRTPIMAIILAGRNNKSDNDLINHLKSLRAHSEQVIKELRSDFNL